MVATGAEGANPEKNFLSTSLNPFAPLTFQV